MTIPVEVLCKINDSPNYATDPVNGWRDGAVIEVKAPGFYFTDVEVTDYLDNDIVPASWASMRQHDQDVIARRLNQIKYLVEPGRTALEVTTIRWPDDPNNVDHLATAQQMIAQAEETKFQLATYGLDSNWGWNDLRVHGVVLVDVDWNDYLNVTDPPIDTALHPVAMVQNEHRRRYRCMYETFTNASYQADLRDPSIWVAAPRAMTPRTRADFEVIT